MNSFKDISSIEYIIEDNSMDFVDDNNISMDTQTYKNDTLSSVSFQISNINMSDTLITCYLCQDESIDENIFAPESICQCKGSNRIHKCCFNILPNKKECSVCKCPYNIPENEYRERKGSLEVVEEMYINGSKMIYCLNKEKKIEGEFKIIYDNGNPWVTCIYKNGKISGDRIIYNRLYTKKVVEIYDDDGNKMFSTNEIPIESQIIDI